MAKLEPKQDVDHHSCSPGPGEAEDAHAGWELQTLTLAARVSAVEPDPASANMLTQQPYRTTQAPVAKLELKQVDHNSCSPGPRVGTRSEAPQEMPGPGTAADTHASSSSVCS